MRKPSRREFLTQSVMLGATMGLVEPVLGMANKPSPKSRKMTIDLVCGAIGVSANQAQAIDLAARHGFESVQPNAHDLAALDAAGLNELTAKLKSHGLVFGAAGLSVNFRKDQAEFQQGLKELPRLANALQRAGVTRVGTWISPAHGTLTYVQNFRQHADRLRQIAVILADHDLRFGLEYVAPKTSWTSGRHPFIHSMAETKDLISEIGKPRVGFVLDSWHWYTAHETQADLLTLSNEQIVAVDLNDAPAGLAIDEQRDLSRELPCATGVINVGEFLKALQQIGYDGPVRAEPFNAALRKLPTEQAVAATAKAMHKAFAKLK